MVNAMTKETFRLNSSAASLYEDQKVTAMFGPLARAILDVVAVTTDDRILDVACGTGIVSRTIRNKVSTDTAIAGIDINESMLQLAQKITDDQQKDFSWHHGNVTELPFKENAFTAVFCQQGIQYFPDEQAALKEMNRVLASNGQLILSVWGGASDFFVAMAESVSKHINPELGAKYLAPFSFKLMEQLPSMLETAGFKDISVKNLSVDRVITNTEISIPKEILAHPAGQKVQDAGEGVVKAITNDVAIACTKYQSGKDMVIPQRVNLIQAISR